MESIEGQSGDAQAIENVVAEREGHDDSRIVLKVKAKRSPGQLESLKMAQVARKAKAKARKESFVPEVQEEAAPVPEVCKKDYKGLYKQQKEDLRVLRMEQEIRDRLAAATAEAKVREPEPVQVQVPAVPAVPTQSTLTWNRGTPFLMKKNCAW
jgi:hypothetical protein